MGPVAPGVHRRLFETSGTTPNSPAFSLFATHGWLWNQSGVRADPTGSFSALQECGRLVWIGRSRL